ncbi:MAG: hypothetical protein FWH44_00865 [Methanomassiliicoccaceae archaeon]|nr:hypothetical protein [Methanomassiliicoccaceae archaeon]
MTYGVEETLTAICFIVMTAVLVSASVQDIRSREVSDIHWAVIGITGTAALILTSFVDITLERIMICAGSAMIIFDILHDREWPLRYDIPFYALMVLLFAVPMMTSFDDIFVRDSAAIPLCYIIFLAMFFSGVIKGGADAKCLISLAVIFPAYPLMFGYPMISVPSSLVSVILSFPIAVMFLASVLSVLAMLPMILRNITRGDTKIPNMFLGHRMDAVRAEKAHVWPMNAAETSAGTAADADGKIWVTPKIPFIVPITAAALFVTFIGNLLFLL